MCSSRLHQEKNNRIEKEKGDEKGKDGEKQDVGGSQVLLLQLLLLLVLLASWVWPGWNERNIARQGNRHYNMSYYKERPAKKEKRQAKAKDDTGEEEEG